MWGNDHKQHMTKFQKIVLGIVTVITVMLLFTVASLSSKTSSVGGVYNQIQKNFFDGINISAKPCTVTQATNRSTGVTCNGIVGTITTDTTSLAAAGEAEFTVTDTSVAAGDVVLVSLRSGATANTSIPVVTTVANGSFKVELSNVHASTADTGASIINFLVIKMVSS